MSDIEFLKNNPDAPMVPVGTRFTAKADFESDRFKSVYCKGLAYEVRLGNDDLAKLVYKWINDDNVRLGGADAGEQPSAAQVTGVGEVTDK